MHAWVDEAMSVRTGRYVLGAFIGEVGDADLNRSVMRRLRTGRSPRTHWRDERLPSRRRIVAGMYALRGRVLVVEGSPMDPARQERARRKCMERLLIGLDAAGIEMVVLESRYPLLDDRDLALVKSMRSKHWIGSRIQVEFGDPRQEPLLWIPDALCGISLTSSEIDRPALPWRHERVHLGK